MIYEPAEDSFLIERHVKEYIKSKSAKVLDLCSGSCILAAEARKYSDNVTASDINPEAEKPAKEKGIKFIQSDLFSSIKEKFDLILFNPPYLPEDEENIEDKESKTTTTGGKKGCELIEEFLKQAKSHLSKSGKILLVCSTLTCNVEILFRKYSYKFKLIGEEKAFFEKILLYELS